MHESHSVGNVLKLEAADMPAQYSHKAGIFTHPIQSQLLKSLTLKRPAVG